VQYGDDYTTSNVGVPDDKMQAFADFALIEKNSNVLEIGCFDGTMMQLLRDKYQCSIQGCDPCSWVVDAARKGNFHIKCCYFSSLLYKNQTFQTVVLRNVLEHVENPKQFLLDIAQVLDANGVIVLAVPNGEQRIVDGILGSIVPEHFWYFGVLSLTRLLDCDYHQITVAELPGLIMVKAKRKTSLDTNLADPYRSLLTVRPTTSKQREQLTTIRELLNGKDKVCLFGANTCSLELLACEVIRESQITCAIDDDPYKWGKVLVNTDIKVVSRDALRDSSILPLYTTFVVCSYYSQETIRQYLVNEAVPPFRVLTLYPEAKMLEVYE